MCDVESENMKRLSLNLPSTPWQEHGVLVAVSGGADSTALLCSLRQEIPRVEECRRFLAVGHVNHGLRGDESDGDARFVQKLAEQWGLRYFERSILPEEWTQDSTGSREAAARNIRYQFLLETAHQLGFRAIATGHTANDQAETVLHRLVRGTGLSGLSGISAHRQLDEAVTLIRPLLNVRREEIIEYLTENGQRWRNDATNAENDFTRNKIRNRLLPELRTHFNPKIDDALCRLARLARDNQTVLDELVTELLDRCHRHSSNVAEFETPQLRDNLIPLGVTQISAGSKTNPGGYGEGGEPVSTEQFAVSDNRSAGEMAAVLRRLGYDPVWKDWDAGFGG